MSADDQTKRAAPDETVPAVRPSGLRTDTRLHQLLDRTVAFVALLSADGLMEDVSGNALSAGGVRWDEVDGVAFWNTPWWSHDRDVAGRIKAAVRAAMAGETTRFDTIARTVGDGRLPIDFQASPILDEAGRVTEIVVSAVDISEQVARREQLEELLQEMSHRVKNLLATVQGMARMTERVAPPERAFADFQARLDALVAAHEALNESASADEFFSHLVRRLLSHFVAGERERLKVHGPPLRLARDRAKMLGLCIHELATNSIKHGALSTDIGRVAMSLTQDEARGVATFTWTERGGPAVVPPERAGYGTRFVESTLESLFEGPPVLDFAPGGLSVAVSGPAHALFAPT